MATCVQCGVDLEANSKFCNACGAAQPESEPVVDSGLPSDDVTAPSSRQRSVVIAAVVIALVLVAGAGITLKVQADRKAAAAAVAAKHAAALKAAKAEALDALASVEKCESSVEVGVTLNDLSDMSTDARRDVVAFTRSDSSKLLPRFTKALTEASDAYVDSCSEWFANNESAMAKYDTAVDKWVDSGSGKSPDLDDYKDDSEYQQSWADAGLSLDEARAALGQEAASR